MNAQEFFTEFDTPFGSFPFSKIKVEDYLPLLKEGIARAERNLQSILSNSAHPTFENVIEPLEFHALGMDKVASIFFNLLHAERTEELHNIAEEFSTLISKYENDLHLNGELFAKIKLVYDERDANVFDVEKRTVLEKYYKEFVRNGALLDDKQKDELRKIDERLAALSLKFSNNSLQDKNNSYLVIDDIEALSGLSEDFIQQLAAIAQEKKLSGKYVVTLDYPIYVPFMKGCKDRTLREALYRKQSALGYQDNEFNNVEVVKEIAKLRYQRAKLLGYENYAQYALEMRMAQDSKRVRSFLTEILVNAKERAMLDVEEVKTFAKKLDELDELRPWDWAYYAEKLKKERFNLDDEVLRPYLKLENVLDGVFTVAKRLYGIDLVEIDGVETYHEDVRIFEVKEGTRHLGLLYVDLHPRSGKQAGAWATSFRDQYWKDGVEYRPHGSIVCNFARPTEEKPALLTFGEVTTLFHEFGHALHGLLSECHYPSVSGTSVYWDFVELPSQIMENWCFEKECLDLFAKHYETQEPLPFEYVEKIKQSANFLEGYATFRQLSFSLLDMAWYSIDPSGVENIEEFEKMAMEQASLLQRVEHTCMSTSFGHIFAGGYAAGYYSYKWAEVLDAEAFERFKEQGIFNRDVAKRFREEILSKGGSEHPMTLFVRFNGKEPSVQPLLKRAGLSK